MPTPIAKRRRTCLQCRRSRPLTDYPPSGQRLRSRVEMTHTDQWLCSACRRQARIRHPNTSKRLRRELLAASRGRCSYCDRPFAPDERWHADHVLPRARGGAHVLANMVAACSRCNAGILAAVVPFIARLRKAGATSEAGQPTDKVSRAIIRAGVESVDTFWERRRLVRAALDTGWWTYVNDVAPYPHDIVERVAHLSSEARGIAPAASDPENTPTAPCTDTPSLDN